MDLNEHTVQIDGRENRKRRRNGSDTDLKVRKIAPIRERKRDRQVLPIRFIHLLNWDPCGTVGTIAHFEKIIIGRGRRAVRHGR